MSIAISILQLSEELLGNIREGCHHTLSNERQWVCNMVLNRNLCYRGVLEVEVHIVARGGRAPMQWG